MGRATWGAATAMLGKLHINEHNYDVAKGYFKEIIDSNIYSLTADIGDNFDEEHEFNSESIFEVAFSIEAKQEHRMEPKMDQLDLRQRVEQEV